MNRIETLRALISDAQQAYYRHWVRYNTVKFRIPSSHKQVEEYCKITLAIIEYRSWINAFSAELSAAMRCK